jgi:D-beta-D-heptose 7-phosphate kinase/D-beta-D-heptose 1-phosphate adenosyltransferase
VVDPKLRGFFDYGGAHLFKPNGPELAAALGREAPPRGEEELREVRRRLGCRYLLLTLGEEGMTLVGEPGDGVMRIPSEAREVFDVSGAGDTVTAVLSAALAGGDGVPHAAALANFAAGLEVSHLGAVPVARDELLGALEDGGPGGRDHGSGGEGAPG